jgi:hypothetical protein
VDFLRLPFSISHAHNSYLEQYLFFYKLWVILYKPETQPAQQNQKTRGPKHQTDNATTRNSNRYHARKSFERRTMRMRLYYDIIIVRVAVLSSPSSQNTEILKHFAKTDQFSSRLHTQELRNLLLNDVLVRERESLETRRVRGGDLGTSDTLESN